MGLGSERIAAGRAEWGARIGGQGPFHPRCRYAREICVKLEPALAEIAEGHVVACHLRNGRMVNETAS